jgi:hypothetical protein
MDGQVYDSGEHVAAYFRNYTIGQRVLELAKEHPQKNFWCLAGHSHDFCKDRLARESANVFSYGLAGMYGQQLAVVIDTKCGTTDLDRAAQTRRTFPCKDP